MLVVNHHERSFASFRPQNECIGVAPSEFQTLRSSLVDSVINLLYPSAGDRRPLLFFRAPPLSGKSTLCDLLCDRLAKTKPEVLVARVLATRKPSSVSVSEYFKSVYNCELDKFWDFTCDRVLLIDDAHLTYDDVFLWLGLLKNTYERRFRGPRIVLFSSYGSGRHEYNGTDFTVDGFDTFGLNGNDTKPGLQLSRPELDEMIGGSIFAQVRDLIWHLSSAHIGVAHNILSFLAEEFKNKPSESINAFEMELALRSVRLMNYMSGKRGIRTYQTFERTAEKEERFRDLRWHIRHMISILMRGHSILLTDKTRALEIEFLTRFGFLYEDENKKLQFPSNIHMKIWLYSERDSSGYILDFSQDKFVSTCISKMCAEKLQRCATTNTSNKIRAREIQMDLYRLILPYLPQVVLVTPEWCTSDGKGFNALLIRGSSIFWLWEILVVGDDDVDPTKRVETLCKSYGSFTGTFKYVLIDFRQNKHVGRESDDFLYVVFEDSYKKALISGLGKPVTTVELSGR